MCESKVTLSSLLYECATHETMELLPFWIELTRLLERPEEKLTGASACSVKFMLAVASRLQAQSFLSRELSASVAMKVAKVVKQWAR